MSDNGNDDIFKRVLRNDGDEEDDMETTYYEEPEPDETPTDMPQNMQRHQIIKEQLASMFGPKKEIIAYKDNVNNEGGGASSGIGENNSGVLGSSSSSSIASSSSSSISKHTDQQLNIFNKKETTTSSESGTITRTTLLDDCMNLRNKTIVPIYNWQATKTTVKERFSFMFNNELLADIHFIVGRNGNQQCIPAHKFLLSVGSAVFDAMFNGSLAESSQNTIELPDVEPSAFLALLRFLYSDEVNIGPETVMTTLYTAKKYAVPALEKHCVDFLKCNLGSDNAFMLLTQARLFDEPQLASLCLDTIDKNTPEALAADGFTDVDIDTLCAVLERDTLRIREAKLFQFAVKWSEAECLRRQLPLTPENQRSVLGPALNLVRFPLMSVEEFAAVPAQAGLLTDTQIVQLFLYFHVNPKPIIPFFDGPRCSMTGKEQIVQRFTHIESRWGYSGTSDRIRFSVDRRIFVVGFGLYGCIHGPTEYDVQMQLVRTANGKVIASSRTTFSCDGSTYTSRVMFKEPVEILPNISYTACATLKGPDSHYGTKGLRTVTLDCPSGGKVTFQFCYASGNNNGTSVEDGQIPEILFYS